MRRRGVAIGVPLSCPLHEAVHGSREETGAEHFPLNRDNSRAEPVFLELNLNGTKSIILGELIAWDHGCSVSEGPGRNERQSQSFSRSHQLEPKGF